MDGLNVAKTEKSSILILDFFFIFKTLILAFLEITILRGTNVIRATSLVTIIEDINVKKTNDSDIDV